MVSRLPVFSGKRVGKRVPPEMVLPVFVLVVLFFALLIAYPWWVLTIGTLCYLACLPLGWVSYGSISARMRWPRRRHGAAGGCRRGRRRRRRVAGRRRRASRPAQLRRRDAAPVWIGSTMPRATRVLPAAERQDDAGRRYADPAVTRSARRRRASCSASRAPASSSILPKPVRLRTDDALVLDDGGAGRGRGRARAADRGARRRSSGAGAARLASRRPPCAGPGAGAAAAAASAIRRSRRCWKASARKAGRHRCAVRAGGRRLCRAGAARSSSRSRSSPPRPRPP